MIDRCSFCKRARNEVKVLIASHSTGAMICDGCCAWAATDAAPVAHCSSCTVVDGKHGSDCTETAEAS